MTRDPGNTLRKAQQINLTAISKRFNNTVTPTDRLDLYRFKVGDRSRFNLNLKELQANANAALLNQKGRMIFESKRPGRKAETIEAFLNPGVF